jgi:hypothetical protein
MVHSKVVVSLDEATAFAQVSASLQTSRIDPQKLTLPRNRLFLEREDCS